MVQGMESLQNCLDFETIQFQGDIDLSEVGRFKFWTDGARSFVFMGIESCTKADEGVYRCIITNRFGKREHKFKLFISSKW